MRPDDEHGPACEGTAPAVAAAHPHEPEILPTLDAEGRCRVCCLIVERDELVVENKALCQEVERLRHAINAAVPHVERAPNSQQSAAAMRILSAALKATPPESKADLSGTQG